MNGRVPHNFANLVGMKFNRLTAITVAGHRNNKVYWLCLCECGSETVVQAYKLRHGKIKSCGCLLAERARTQNLQHGGYREGHASPEYRSWLAMRARCLNPNSGAFGRYGGRGIKICDRWSDFRNFLADMGPRPSRSHTLDRFPDKNGDYEPGNCRWATKREQALNRNPKGYLEASA